MCDVMYGILLGRLERQVLVEQQTTAVLMAAGAKVEPPKSFEQAHAAFDVELASEPTTRRLRLLRDLGVA